MYTVEEILPIYEKAALCVELYGEEAVPCFLRAEQLLEEAKQSEGALERARRVAREGLNSS
jgi:hypothetical protein